MKKLLALILSVALIAVFFSVPVLADSEEEELLRLIKSRIASTDEYENFSSNIYNEDEGKRYYFNWESHTDDSYKEMSLTALPGGIIISYSNYDSDSYMGDSSKIQKASYDEALKRANELFQVINPDLYGHITISRQNDYETLGISDYAFNIQRIENGVAVAGDDGYLSLSSDMTKINSFYITYSQTAEFKEPENTISAEAAKEAFSEKIGMRLVYKLKYNKEGGKEAYPVYVPSKNNTYIDAFTGEAYKPLRSYYFFRNSAASKGGMAEDSSEEQWLSEAERNELAAHNALMTPEKAEEEVRKISVFNISENAEFEWSSLYKDRINDRYIYMLEFLQDDDYISVSMDAKTGEIIGLFRSYYYETEEKLSSNELKEKAYAILKQIAPSHFAEGREDYELYEFGEEDEENLFEFVRMIGSIPCIDDRISLTINPADGSVLSYSIDYTRVDFPSVENCISKESACDILIKNRGMELVYIPERSSEDIYYNDKFTLVYSPDTSQTWTIDAVSGKFTGEADKLPDSYTDISGHYAEKAINELKAYAVGYSTPEFQPDKPITQKEFINLLVHVLNWNSPVTIDDTDSLNFYSYSDILKREEKPSDRSITRLEAAVYLIRALGIEEYASLSEIYNSPFTDVPSDKVGYTAILYGMKITNGNGSGIFNSEANLTRADAVVMTYNYLNR